MVAEFGARGQVLPRHFLRCGPFDHLQAEGMTDPPDVLDQGGEKLKKTIPIPVIFKDPAPKVARQDLTPSPCGWEKGPMGRHLG